MAPPIASPWDTRETSGTAMCADNSFASPAGWCMCVPATARGCYRRSGRVGCRRENPIRPASVVMSGWNVFITPEASRHLPGQPCVIGVSELTWPLVQRATMWQGQEPLQPDQRRLTAVLLWTNCVAPRTSRCTCPCRRSDVWCMRWRSWRVVSPWLA